MFDSVRANDGAMDPDLSLHRILEGITIPNGATWSPDDRTMYFADSTTQNIYAFDFDPAGGSMSNKRVFFSTADMGEDAVLDGHCINEEGYMGQQFMAKTRW